jgi:hypothetical protein
MVILITFSNLLIDAILFACSPKFREINGNGFGGSGSQPFKNVVSNTNSKLEKVDGHLAENDKQFSEKVNIEPESMVVAKSEKLRSNSRQFQNLNGKAANNIQLKKGGMDHPKVSKLLKKLAFKSKTQKKNEVDSEIVNIWFKVFLISLIAAACMMMSSVFIFFVLGAWETALLVFTISAYLGFASLVVGFITLILWLMTL